MRSLWCLFRGVCKIGKLYLLSCFQNLSGKNIIYKPNLKIFLLNYTVLSVKSILFLSIIMFSM